MLEVNGSYKHGRYETNWLKILHVMSKGSFCHARWTTIGRTNMTHYRDPHDTHMDQKLKLALKCFLGLCKHPSVHFLYQQIREESERKCPSYNQMLNFECNIGDLDHQHNQTNQPASSPSLHFHKSIQFSLL